MTPLGQGPEGYADWQRIVNYDGSQLLTVTNVPIGAGITRGPVQVSRFAALQGRFFHIATAVDFSVTLTWLSAKAGGETLGSLTFCHDGANEAVGNVSIPNLGPWVKLDIAGAGSVPSIHLSGSNRAGLPLFVPRNAIFTSGAHAFGGAGGSVISPVDYWAGPAQVLLFAGVAVAFVDIEALIEPATWVKVDRVVANAGTLVMQRVNLPATACRYNLQVNGASTVEMTVTPFRTGSS